MLAKFLSGVRRFFGLEPPPPPQPSPDEATAADWWIPKDRKALAAAQSETRRRALIERLDSAKARQGIGEPEPPVASAPELGTVRDEASAPDAAPTDTEMIDVDLEQFATLDEVAAMLADRRRNRDAEERRIAAVELPQAMMMDDQEYAIAKDWMLDHRTLHPLPKTEISGQYWVRFARTSAGDAVSIGCATCGKSKVLTDHARVTESTASSE